MKYGDKIQAAYKVTELAAALGINRRALKRRMARDGAKVLRGPGASTWIIPTYEFRSRYPLLWEALVREFQLVPGAFE